MNEKILIVAIVLVTSLLCQRRLKVDNSSTPAGSETWWRPRCGPVQRSVRPRPRRTRSTPW